MPSIQLGSEPSSPVFGPTTELLDRRNQEVHPKDQLQSPGPGRMARSLPTGERAPEGDEQSEDQGDTYHEPCQEVEGIGQGPTGEEEEDRRDDVQRRNRHHQGKRKDLPDDDPHHMTPFAAVASEPSRLWIVPAGIAVRRQPIQGSVASIRSRATCRRPPGTCTTDGWEVICGPSPPR